MSNEDDLVAALILLFSGRERGAVVTTIRKFMGITFNGEALGYKLLEEAGAAIAVIADMDRVKEDIEDNGEEFTGSDEELRKWILSLEWNVPDSINDGFYFMREEMLKNMREHGVLVPVKDGEAQTDAETHR